MIADAHWLLRPGSALTGYDRNSPTFGRVLGGHSVTVCIHTMPQRGYDVNSPGQFDDHFLIPAATTTELSDG
jgi:hypothetical protein